MDGSKTASGTLAAYLGRLDNKELPTEVAHMARLCVMDWIGCAVAGSVVPGAKILRGVVAQSWAAGLSSLVGGDAAVDAAGAALHNGYASHALEYDDTHPGAF